MNNKKASNRRFGSLFAVYSDRISDMQRSAEYPTERREKHIWQSRPAERKHCCLRKKLRPMPKQRFPHIPEWRRCLRAEWRRGRRQRRQSGRYRQVPRRQAHREPYRSAEAGTWLRLRKCPGPGGVDNIQSAQGRNTAPGFFVLVNAALGAAGDIDQSGAKFVQNFLCRVLRAGEKEKCRLLGAQLDNVGLGQAPQHLLARFIRGPPEGEAQVRVEADELVQALRAGKGFFRAASHRFLRQRQGAEMENPCLFNVIQPHLLGEEPGVGSRLEGKGKLPVAAFVERDEGKGGKNIAGCDKAAVVNAGPAQTAPEKAPESVVPHLAQKGGFCAEFGQGRQIIGGRPAGMGLHRGVAILVQSLAGEVYQKLADSNYIIHFQFLPKAGWTREV